MQGINQLLAETGKERLVIQFTPATLGIAALRIGKDQIDIGREIQLTAAQLAHAEDQHLLGLTAFPADRCPDIPAHPGIQPVVCRHDQAFRQHREMPETLFHR